MALHDVGGTFWVDDGLGANATVETSWDISGTKATQLRLQSCRLLYRIRPCQKHEDERVTDEEERHV
jgi:hypothetical protein